MGFFGEMECNRSFAHVNSQEGMLRCLNLYYSLFELMIDEGNTNEHEGKGVDCLISVTNAEAPKVYNFWEHCAGSPNIVGL